MAERRRKPMVVVIAGPNGAGKTTFARRFLSETSGIVHFVNADLIAAGLSPLKPEMAAMAAAREWTVYDNSGQMPQLMEKGP
ncbi:MAG: zeta toxin family protein [Steroidobacteraceae bacterium]